MIIKLGRALLLNKTVAKNYCTAIKMSTGDKEGLPLMKVVSVLEEFAPKELAGSWDNVGLLVEPYTPRNITKILLTNDLTHDVACEANVQGCDMIISYHPPIFAPMKSVVQSSWKQRIVSLLLENRISLYSPHTSWDCIRGGVNDWLASAFPVATSVPINPRATPEVGEGRLLTLQDSIKISDAISRVKQLTGLEHLRVGLARSKSLDDVTRVVALCAGSGGSVLKETPADLYLTGEMLHHDILDATQNGITVILTNHSDSERGFLKLFSSQLTKLLDDQVVVLVSKCDRDPLATV